jgi:GT2 family glycosyltransferase
MGQYDLCRDIANRVGYSSLAGKKRAALMQPIPLVSIIITYWNNAEHLPHCLRCLSLQTFQDFEIVIIDNGSLDGGTDQLEQTYPQLRIHIERLPSNKGFAVANNLGAEIARGRWLALLNTDAFPEPEWLEKILQAANKHPEFSFFSCRQIQSNQPDILDGSGDEYHISGLAWRRFYNYPAHNFGLKEEEVFSACAAASMYHRDDFLKVGGFDEDYFSYFEDVDLSFRLRLGGGRCLYVPQAVVYHVGSASSGKTSNFVIYYGHRNLVWTFFKNMPGPLFWLYLPLHILINVLFVISFLLKKRGTTILRAKMDAFFQLPAIIRKRNQIQNSRKATVLAIWQVLNRDLLAPYRVTRYPRKKT